MKKLLAIAALGAAMLGVGSAATAQDAWPLGKPVNVLVPFPPGGSTDMIARVVAAKLPEKLGGGSFVVNNIGGAGGTIGAAQAKRAAPDGYTIFVSSLGPFVIGPHLIKNLQYNPLTDFDYLTVAVQAPNVLAVPAASPFKSVKEVMAQLKSTPDKVTFASAGVGTSDHLTAELFWQETGTKGTHVPYQGGGPAMLGLLGGEVDMTFMNINTALPNIKAGKLRALAITSSKRSPLLPNVPTMEEEGFTGVTVYSWQAFALPVGVPAAIKQKLHGAIVAVLNDPAVKQPLLDLGFEIVGNSPDAFTAFQKSEFARWKKVIETGKITADP
jgi:tripartite-type tricarboxylate transporter receptor subunit TctC